MVAQTECRVADRVIGPGHPLFFIAEIGLNHNQDLDLAIGLIDAAADAGCSAAKFQTFQASDVYVEGSRAGIYHLMGQEIPIFDLHKGLEMSAEWVRKLKAHCDA
ncbi:MAG: N,N'-diacetyllegionaminate synthase, partial [Gammaproteobacteria bacterium]